jgi:hypothetical protein
MMLILMLSQRMWSGTQYLTFENIPNSVFIAVDKAVIKLGI